MPRSNWKGYISFGLVNIPITLHNPEDTKQRVSFHQIDKKTHARVKLKRVSAETGKEIPWDNIIRGYQYDKETILPVEDDELKKVVGDNARTIAIETFVNDSSIDFVDIEKTYYLLPEKKGEKGYVILREALKDSKKIGIAKVIISTKEYLSAIAYYNGALVLYLLHYQDELKDIEEFSFPEENLKKYHVTKKEVDVAVQLIKSMSSKWKPEQYKDEYGDVVRKWAENKVKHQQFKKVPQRANLTETNGKIINFVDLLKKSLASGKKTNATKKSPAIHKHIKKKQHAARRTALH